jgi:hypothetical protein
MPIYEMTADSLKPIPVTRYGDNDIKERGDLQRLLRDNIEIVSSDTLIIPSARLKTNSLSFKPQSDWVKLKPSCCTVLGGHVNFLRVPFLLPNLISDLMEW